VDDVERCVRGNEVADRRNELEHATTSARLLNELVVADRGYDARAARANDALVRLGSRGSLVVV
jgi:hypothetical protein